MPQLLSNDHKPSEGLEEPLTLQRLGITKALYRTLRSANPIENLNSLIGRFTRNVKRWRDGSMTQQGLGLGGAT